MKKILTVAIWINIIALSGITYYVNHHLPKGPMYETGDVACKYDGRVCGLEKKEDISQLNIPNWAKFFKKDYPIVLIMGLFVLVILINNKVDE